MSHFLAVLGNVSQLIQSNYGASLSVLAVVYGISKRVSTEKAVPVVAGIQMAFDGLAHALSGLGQIVQECADLLSDAIKSDGILGKK